MFYQFYYIYVLIPHMSTFQSAVQYFKLNEPVQKIVDK